jgi:hypothetical protein
MEVQQPVTASEKEILSRRKKPEKPITDGVRETQ